MATILSVIAPENFQYQEYGDSKKVLEKAGHTVVTACSEPMARSTSGHEEFADVLLDEVNVDDYDAILFVGGGGCYDYFNDSTALELAREFYEAEKLTTAICAAPSILANAGLLEGKKATCFSSQADNLKAHKAEYTGASVEVDGLLITADGPASAKAFGEMIVKKMQ
ncbi:DJ-1 family protein [Candidatus Peregrinibacteria bacterium CG_4_10_14_0_2_um_filter_43_11]|nr:MAG: DJ-1 family protein [Candidatus Peregrinibacteria bacterium CG_4_10_14_0_2_um_filter_43_11]